MRAYNANPAHTQKVFFAGFDCQEIETNTYDNVTQHLQSVDPQSVSKVAQLYQGLRPDPAERVDSFKNLGYCLHQSGKVMFFQPGTSGGRNSYASAFT